MNIKGIIIINFLANTIIIDEILKRKIGFFGLGQMGGVLVKSFSKYLNDNFQDDYKTDFKDHIYICDRTNKRREEFKNYGFKNFMKNELEVAQNSKIIFNCVKPDNVVEVLTKSHSAITIDHLIVSIAAGISINYLEFQYTKQMPKIIRIMTNHLCLVNAGGSVYSSNKNCDLTDEEIVHGLLGSLGIVKKVEEKHMDAFTALAGSSPAFIYQFIESLVDAGVKNGIDVHTAREYAIQAVYGAGKYMKENKDKSPNNAQYIVATPKGTTIAGLDKLGKHKFKYAVSEAVTAATKRSSEIEKEKTKLMKKNLIEKNKLLPKH